MDLRFEECQLTLFRWRFQVRFRSFANLLSFLGPAPAPHDCLLVLGQCVGTCLIGGALLYNMRSIQGLHLMQVSYNFCLGAQDRSCFHPTPFPTSSGSEPSH